MYTSAGIRSLLFATLALGLASGCSAAPSPSLAISVIGTIPGTPDPLVARDQAVTKIYDAAKRHDLTTLQSYPTPSPPITLTISLATPSPSPSPTPTAGSTANSPPPAGAALDPAVALALYSIDASRYRDTFVASYPTEMDGVTHDYGDRLERAHLFREGQIFPVSELTRIAVGGDYDAIARLIAAFPAARGSLETLYADDLGYLATRRPEEMLAVLVRSPTPVRLYTISAAGWCVHHPDRLLREPASTTGEHGVQDGVRLSMREHCAPPKPHGHAHTKRPAKHPAPHLTPHAAPPH